MEQISTNFTIIRDVTTIPHIFEVKQSEEWAFGDFPALKRKRDESLIYCSFWKGHYSYSLVTAERNKEIVPLAIFHRENIDPGLLVKSWLDSDKRPCFVVSTPRTILTSDHDDADHQPKRAKKNDKDYAVEDCTELEKVVAANFSGRFCFIKHSEFLRAKAPELQLSQEGIYKMELDDETVGIAIDATDVFGDAELSSVLFAEAVSPYYALALQKTIGAPRAWGESITIESVLYGNRSFYNDGMYIENPYYCFDPTMGDFSILDPVFVKVLLYVPWRQRIVCRRVNKRWMKLCNVAVSIDTKTIRQDDQQFRRMNTDDLWRLLPIVCRSLEEIRWRNLCRSQRLPDTLHRIPAFPNLRTIDMGDERPPYEPFFSLLDKCPNLRELWAKIPAQLSTEYPGTYQVEKLTMEIEQESTKDNEVMGIINLFPRLSYLRCEYAAITAEGVQMLIGKYGEQLAHLQICCSAPLESNGHITGMEKCRNLEYLELSSADFLSDDFMKSVANGCQKLRTLDIGYSDKVTNEGLTALASLPNLKQLKIAGIEKDLSEGISRIAEKGHLEQLIAHEVGLSPTCLKACVGYCQQLKLLDERGNQIDVSLEDAKEIIHLFNVCSVSSHLPNEW